jgi:glycine hydroxymethyltransferase
MRLITAEAKHVAHQSGETPGTYDYLRVLTAAEQQRRNGTLTLIASEWAMPRVVRQALSSIFAEKYFEGTPSNESLDRLTREGLIRRDLVRLKRPGWYAPGCELYDDLSWLCQSRALELFDPNNQVRYYLDNRVLSGSQANQAVFLSIVKRTKRRQLRVLCLAPDHGGHLSHGLKTNVSGLLHDISYYSLDATSATVPMEELARELERQPVDLLIYGGSACPRDWDHHAFVALARRTGTNLLFDGSHPAGLIAAGLNNNPFAAGVDFITMTTNKTLCGARGAFVACLPSWAETLARAVFPGLTAGPHGHEMYAKLVGYEHSMTESFRSLMQRVQHNARALAARLRDEHGLTLIGHGTDTHMVLIDLRSVGVESPSGMDVERWAAGAGIYVNRNTIPQDPSPDQNVTSGIRIGVGVASQRGMGEPEMRVLADAVAAVTRNGRERQTREEVRHTICELLAAFPLGPDYADGAVT